MKIGIFALLQNLDPAYSVATVVRSHIRMLKKHGHEVVLLTSTDSCIKSDDVDGAEVRCIIPVWQFHDYATRELREEDGIHVFDVLDAIKTHASDIDCLIDHDCCLQGWFKVHGEALNLIPNVRHVIHSVPVNQPIAKLGEGHKLLVLNENQRKLAMDAYGMNDVEAIPNPLDIREFLGMSPVTKTFIQDWNLLSYDRIITYPLSATRWGAKGVDFLDAFCHYMRNQGQNVALVLLLAHVDDPKKFSFGNGVFSNVMRDEWKQGVPREVVRDFMLLSDGFFLPSASELSPLVHLEAALAKNTVFLNGALKLDSVAPTFNASERYNWNFDALMRDFLERSKHLDEFRRVRKFMNEDAIGKRLNDWVL